MPRITVNPDVESAGGFPVWAAATYRLRVDEVKEKTSGSGKAMLNVKLVPVDVVNDDKGNPISSPGSLYDNIMVEPVKGKSGGTFSFLRPFVESCGLVWGDFDTDQLQGRECTAKVVIGEYNGNERNEVARYLKAA